MVYEIGISKTFCIYHGRFIPPHKLVRDRIFLNQTFQTLQIPKGFLDEIAKRNEKFFFYLIIIFNFIICFAF
jgi:hypothetical protein